MATQKQVFTEITESIDRCNHTLPGLIQFLKNGFKKLENATGSGGGGSEVSWTQTQATGTKIAEIEINDVSTNVYVPAVSATQIQSTGTKIASLTIGSDTTDLYAPTTSVSVQASDVAYSNTVSGLTADNCQEAIDELKSLIPGSSGSVSVTADGVKTYSALLDELYASATISDINTNSRIGIISGTTQIICTITSIITTEFSFTSTSIGGGNPPTNLSISRIIIKTSGSKYDTFSGGYADYSTTVATAGESFTLYY